MKATKTELESGSLQLFFNDEDSKRLILMSQKGLLEGSAINFMLKGSQKQKILC
jgi:hypothetical protein